MSHQVLITFDLDENKVAENAEKEAGRQIAKQIIDVAFGGAYNRDALLRQYVVNVIAEILNPSKEEIIDKAISELVANLNRTKIVREKLAEKIGECDDGEEGA